EELGVEPQVPAQLRVEAAGPHIALPHQHRSVLAPGEHLGGGGDVEDLRGADEGAVEGALEALDVQRRGEGLTLPAVGIAGNGDVEAAEAVITAQRIIAEPIGQEDEAGAGAEDRQAGSDALPQSAEEIGAGGDADHGRRLAAGQEDRVEDAQVLGTNQLPSIDTQGYDMVQVL